MGEGINGKIAIEDKEDWRHVFGHDKIATVLDSQQLWLPVHDQESQPLAHWAEGLMRTHY